MNLLEALFSSELAAYAAMCCLSAYPLVAAVGENICSLTPVCHSSGWQDERCPRRSSGCEGAVPVTRLVWDPVLQLSRKLWTCFKPLFSSELAANAAVCCISAYPLLPAVSENTCSLTPVCHSSGWKDERCPRRSSGCEGAMPVETLAGDLVPQLYGKIWTRAHSYSL